MSTRALYTFKKADKNDQDWNVYKHHDGYPTGAAQHLARALNFAWQLPRYEADDFAAAFIAANKPHWLGDGCVGVDPNYVSGGRYHQDGVGGGVHLMPQGNPLKVAAKNCSEIEYRYELFQKRNKLHVRAYRTSIAWREDQTTTDELLFVCTLDEMPDFAKSWTEAQETVTA